MYYLFNIVFYSIIGFLFEMSTQLLFGFNAKSGIGYGPYSLIYGLGISFMFFIYSKIEKKYSIKNFYKYLIFFLIAFVFLTTFEYIGGILIEKIFNVTFWNYEDFLFSIGPYISLETSTIWGIMPILVYIFIKPKTDYLFTKINNSIIFSSFFIIIFDYSFSFIKKY